MSQEDEGEPVVLEEAPTVEEPEEELQPKVSLNSVVGLSSPKTMKLKGVIQDQEVLVMIDPGATHNFISTGTVARLKLPMVSTKGFAVTLGNGEEVKGEGECHGIVLQLADIDVIETFLPFPLGNCDVILGVQWLEKLGTVTTNWKIQEMRFKVGKKSVVVKGDPSLEHTQISLKAMMRTIRKAGGGIIVELQKAQVVPNEQADCRATKPDPPSFLQPTLQRYNKVFQLPPGLPPSRNHEHAITLKQGSDPVSVRPYRYPQFQKDEI